MLSVDDTSYGLSEIVYHGSHDTAGDAPLIQMLGERLTYGCIFGIKRYGSMRNTVHPVLVAFGRSDNLFSTPRYNKGEPARTGASAWVWFGPHCGRWEDSRGRGGDHEVCRTLLTEGSHVSSWFPHR